MGDRPERAPFFPDWRLNAGLSASLPWLCYGLRFVVVAAGAHTHGARDRGEKIINCAHHLSLGLGRERYVHRPLGSGAAVPPARRHNKVGAALFCTRHNGGLIVLDRIPESPLLEGCGSSPVLV